jgi:hypothetical protein
MHCIGSARPRGAHRLLVASRWRPLSHDVRPPAGHAQVSGGAGTVVLPPPRRASRPPCRHGRPVRGEPVRVDPWLSNRRPDVGPGRAATATVRTTPDANAARTAERRGTRIPPPTGAECPTDGMACLREVAPTRHRCHAPPVPYVGSLPKHEEGLEVRWSIATSVGPA